MNIGFEPSSKVKIVTKAAQSEQGRAEPQVFAQIDRLLNHALAEKRVSVQEERKFVPTNRARDESDRRHVALAAVIANQETPSLKVAAAGGLTDIKDNSARNQKSGVPIFLRSPNSSSRKVSNKPSSGRGASVQTPKALYDTMVMITQQEPASQSR